MRTHSFRSGSARHCSGRAVNTLQAPAGCRTYSGIIMNLSKRKRDAVREQLSGRCAFCGSTLPAKDWHAEYIGKNYINGGIAAVCTECRTSKGNASPEVFRTILAEQVVKAQRHSVNFRTALRFGLCHVKAEPVVFWFERCASAQPARQILTLKKSHSQSSAA